ncbi:MAG: MmgE/PrpD family protein [Alphaproteobacteria bacterium]|jgi:2-methylcitrate dehydratase PrpD|nr:MmgE/PrpD family protein [Alphaproteobacteria bacterium]
MSIRRFADFAAGLSNADVPPDTLHAAKRAVIDWFASTLPGGMVPPATMLVEAFADSSGTALLYPSGRTTDARTAAFINGAAAHTIEFDDIYRDGLYHPAAPVISAVMAVAQALGLGGDAFLRAVIAGYEVSNRMAVAVNPAHYEYWHTTGTIGTFGAAAGAGVALGLDGETIGHAMANAGTLAAGLQQAFRADAMAKPLHTAHAAQTGVILAMAAEKGVTGAMDILEGERGFGAAMCRNGIATDGPDWEAAADALASSFTIERMTFKNHAACGHTHPAIDGVLAIRNENALTADDIAQIKVETFQKAVEICGNADPRTIFEAKFSLPYCAAMAMTTGRVRMEAFSDDWLKNQPIRTLIEKIEVADADDLSAEFPKRRAARIHIEATDGRRFEHYSPTRKGDPDNPLTDDELAEKFLELCGPVLGATGAGVLLGALWRLEEAADMVSLPIDMVPATAAQ